MTCFHEFSKYEHKGLWHIWSQTHVVLGHFAPHNWFPIDWSFWVNGPQLIQSPWTNGPEKFGLHGRIASNQFDPPGQMVPRISWLSMGTGCGDLEIWGPEWLGTICPGGPNFLGPFVHGDQIWWGLFVQGDQFYEDCLSIGTGSGGPEVQDSNRLCNYILFWLC